MSTHWLTSVLPGASNWPSQWQSRWFGPGGDGRGQLHHALDQLPVEGDEAEKHGRVAGAESHHLGADKAGGRRRAIRAARLAPCLWGAAYAIPDARRFVSEAECRWHIVLVPWLAEEDPLPGRHGAQAHATLAHDQRRERGHLQLLSPLIGEEEAHRKVGRAIIGAERLPRQAQIALLRRLRGKAALSGHESVPTRVSAGANSQASQVRVAPLPGAPVSTRQVASRRVSRSAIGSFYSPRALSHRASSMPLTTK